MHVPTSEQTCPLLGNRSQRLQWAALLFLSAAIVLALEALHLPAALLLGPMAAAIGVAAAKGTIRVAPRPFFLAQGVIGCLIAHSIPVAILGDVLRNWPLFLAGVVSVIGASSLLGWLLTRWRVLPGSTAIWGSAPGAATAMTLMADAYGADVRLVAFMQYLRVVCVAVLASVVSRLWVAGPAHAMPSTVWFPALAWPSFLGTLALAGGGTVLARLLRVPGGQMLLPLAGGIILQDAGWMTLELPPWLLALGYAVIGWNIGLRFSRPILAHAARALPRVLASIMALVAICGGFAALLVVFAGVDPLTAYLATSPGGADSVAIIAASTKVDVPFVMTMQTARFLVVLLAGPSLARLLADKHSRRPQQTPGVDPRE